MMNRLLHPEDCGIDRVLSLVCDPCIFLTSPGFVWLGDRKQQDNCLHWLRYHCKKLYERVRCERQSIRAG